MKRLLTQDEYVHFKGMQCPACHESSEVTRIGDIESPPGTGAVYQQYRCRECGATWTETFVLRGYSELEIPKGEAI